MTSLHIRNILAQNLIRECRTAVTIGTKPKKYLRALLEQSVSRASVEKAKTGDPIFAFGFYAVPENFPDCIFTISLDFHRLHGFIDVTAGSHNASQTSERQSSAVIHARANGRIVAGSEVVTGRGAANVEAFDRFIILV